jgi:hypothetical protein
MVAMEPPEIHESTAPGGISSGNFRRRNVTRPGRQHATGPLAVRLIATAALAVLVFGIMATAAVFVRPPDRIVPAAGPAAPHGAAFVGVTHAQHSADPHSPGAAAGGRVLRTVGRVQNQHIMGFGALNPEPRPGVYDWRSLDSRMDLIARTGGTPMITLCCSPDWMKGGTPGRTDWSRIAVAPREEHFDDFAALSAAVARRYPEVRTYQVWNELKGFYSVSAKRWDIEAYTRLYNKVYASLKAVDPKIKVGGPYVVMDSYAPATPQAQGSEVSGGWGAVDQRSLDAVRYWLRHKAGADFIAVDAHSGTRDNDLIVSDIRATDKFVAVNRWLTTQTRLPIWWSEIYPQIADQAAPADSPRRAAVALYCLIRVFNSGAHAALLWQPQQARDLRSIALWTATTKRKSGRELPFVLPMNWLQNALAGNRRLTVTWNGQATVARDGRSTLILDSLTGRTTITPDR